MRSLIVAAHPDDEVLGCGGVMGRYAASQEFYVLILTGGAAGRYAGHMAGDLRASAEEAGRILGVRKVFFEDLPNQGLDAVPLTTVIGAVEKHVAALAPDTLFIHSDRDLNKDHRIAYEACLTAARPLAGCPVRRVYTYFVASSTEWGAVPWNFNTFVSIAGSLDAKVRAMQAYPSECRPYPHPRSPETIRAYASFWGLQAGLEAAEPFCLLRDVGDLR